MGPDGKTEVTESAWEKHKGSSKLTSIMTRVCNSVNELNIKEFFSNAGLRAAWKRVLPDLRRRYR
jgi:hypothetical protein